MKKIYRIKPVYLSFIWGGRKLIDAFNIETDLDNIGTIYNVIALPGHLDNEVEGTGQTLSEFYKNNKALFGCDEEIFPVRMTITCNEGMQSYHLHPTDAYALTHDGTKGKVSGAVSITESDSVKRSLFGNKAVSLDHFKELVANKDWDNLFTYVEVKEGDYLHTPAGVIHGGKGGGGINVTFSTNSDITYRFYDYDRNDPERKLHMQEVYDCVNIPEVPFGPIHAEPIEQNGISLYKYYNVAGEYIAMRIKTKEKGSFQYDKFLFMTCVEGCGEIDGYSIKPGETVFIPVHYGPISFKGKMDLMVLSYRKS
ncbi:class I mannose-6-phosphate isomerase [Anaeropeptidivorans aminofermentans]|uniref:class I mannose-6-phosphate isomerase n=1 Tax=Anaeropeptidivorans aminofermentans TaxID=2934315 RepID=UPI00202517EF|nr:mannose-6-phosphate isomerase [Anaeropeptidivorans aminofermentans]